jgi:hypothetical protein
MLTNIAHFRAQQGTDSNLSSPGEGGLMKIGLEEWWQLVLDAAKRIRPRRVPTETIILDEFHRFLRPIDPNLKIYDPASGSAGFLVHALMAGGQRGAAAEQILTPQERAQLRNAQERSVQRMMQTSRKTALASLVERFVRHFKPKPLDMDEGELARYIAELLHAQNGRCKLSGLPLQWDGTHTDVELLCSLDRIDSAKGYVRGNLQVVCRFINRWKSSSDNETFRRLLDVVRSSESFEIRPRDERRLHRL